MNKEEITSQLKEILNKYPNKQLEILFYVFGRDNLMKIINEPTYEELQQENKELHNKIDKAIEYINQLEHSDWICFGRKILLEILKDSEVDEN